MYLLQFENFCYMLIQGLDSHTKCKNDVGCWKLQFLVDDDNSWIKAKLCENCAT